MILVCGEVMYGLAGVGEGRKWNCGFGVELGCLLSGRGKSMT